MKDPVIVVNFKVYESSVGKNAIILSKILDSASKETNSSIAVCVSAPDISRVFDSVNIPVFCEHVDGVDFGARTGKILSRAIKENGAIGSLINHSEDRIPMDAIKAAVDALKKENMISIVCAKDDFESADVSKFNPDYVAVEPPELIGGDISVTTANPDIIKRTVDAIKQVSPNVKVLCGAGVKTGADVKKAIELGCSGVLLASGITKVADPRKAILDMCSGLK
ncbi:MAG: triose-phosphate isomerase [Candidatus Woesearchaeota archaeon]|jgi:triosephosphate isomerase